MTILVEGVIAGPHKLAKFLTGGSTHRREDYGKHGHYGLAVEDVQHVANGFLLALEVVMEHYCHRCEGKRKRGYDEDEPQREEHFTLHLAIVDNTQLIAITTRNILRCL